MPRKLTKPQIAMLTKASAQGFVLAPAGVKTAWILERAGLLSQGKRVTRTRHVGPGYVRETYLYEMTLTEKGRAVLGAGSP